MTLSSPFLVIIMNCMERVQTSFGNFLSYLVHAKLDNFCWTQRRCPIQKIYFFQQFFLEFLKNCKDTSLTLVVKHRDIICHVNEVLFLRIRQMVVCCRINVHITRLMFFKILNLLQQDNPDHLFVPTLLSKMSNIPLYTKGTTTVLKDWYLVTTKMYLLYRVILERRLLESIFMG